MVFLHNVVKQWVESVLNESAITVEFVDPATRESYLTNTMKNYSMIGTDNETIMIDYHVGTE